jgi:hypothetical protein
MTTMASLGGMLRAEPGSRDLLREWIPWSAAAGLRGSFYLAVPFHDYLETDVDEFRRSVMQWPKLPASLEDETAMLNHYKAALNQANAEGRDAGALRREASERGFQLGNGA